MYRSGALCYRNCETIDMVNCGWWACAADSSTCGTKIADMALNVLSGLADLVGTITTFGGATAAKKAATTAIK